MTVEVENLQPICPSNFRVENFQPLRTVINTNIEIKHTSSNEIINYSQNFVMAQNFDKSNFEELNINKMEKIKFKTNINCSMCVAKVTPFLNEEKGIENWTVDTQNPEKTLTIIGAGDLQPEQIEQDVIEAVKKAGFKIEKK